ncbi:carbon-nitrogen hydrolase family protein [Candidatus Nitrospira nitrosa]|nr:carbon-nitrogen hydrolase family protein [Candidatus Nitrospira nitrosa]
MRIARCQLPEVLGDIERATSLMRDYAFQAERQGADLVCFPECFLQGYDIRPEYIASVAVELSSPMFNDVLRSFVSILPVMVFGMIEKADGFAYNSALAIQGGKVIAHYRKRHLLDGEAKVFGRGNGFPVFDVCEKKVGINICHDLNVSKSIESAAASGVSVLVCPCNNMLPRVTAEEWKCRHNEIRARHAKAHGVWILSSDVTGERGQCISYGPTAVIDPTGAIIAQVPLQEVGMVVAEVGFV